MVRPKDSDGIKSSLIVSEVQKRPCLFDTNHVNYGDRNEKAKSWEEVCQIVVPGWFALGLEQKFAAGKEVQKRWRSIRDSYTKAYRQGKCVLPQNFHPGHRRVQYHRQMAFLLKVLQNKKPRFSCEKWESMSELSNSPQHTLTDDFKPKNDHLEKPLDLKNITEKDAKIPQTTDIKETELSCNPQSLPLNFTNKGQQTDSNTEHIIKQFTDIPYPIEIKSESASVLPDDYFDDDKMFMSSLIPFFKKMDDDARLFCRIEVLKVIRQALQGHHHGFSNFRFEDRGVQEKPSTLSRDGYQQTNISLSSKESALSMVTRSADGSRPMKKRMLRSPSPVQPPPKRRGPGRPRKIKPPPSDSDEEESSRRKFKRSPPISLEPRLSEYDQKIHQATSVAQLETPVFMKMYNLERSKNSPQPILLPSLPQSTPPTNLQVSVKTEPVDSV